MENYRYIYGPVYSWRLGVSLGIDAISQKDKICNFDCRYCQLGKTTIFSNTRKIYIKETDLINEIKRLPSLNIDYITFSGRGEPTLAKNLGTLIKAIKSIRPEKIAIITNSTLLGQKDVIKDLSNVDLVVAKLDAFDQESLENINQPMNGITFKEIITGLIKFRSRYAHKLALQIMFIKDNIKHADKLAALAEDIKPDVIQINTPLRKSPVKPLSRKELDEIKKYFCSFNIISVYDVHKKEIKPISTKNTLIRRGKK